MRLKNFTSYQKITLQCHDNPDADSIASGFALYTYFKENSINVRLAYSGRFQIQKSNLKLMVEKLEIPIFYIPINEFVIDDSELLITVDCQYGAGNISSPKAINIAIIDHHQVEIDSIEDSLIISNMNSCSTIVWQLLSAEGFDVNSYTSVATALYYGLFTDTLQFAEISNPADKDMRDSLNFSRSIISLLRNSNLSISEIEIAGIAMIRTIYNKANRFSLTKAKQCDPNILGLISDMCIQVDTVDSCVVYNELDDGIKFSVRSCFKETKASDLASYLTNGVGSGGGHLEKAGGFISKSLYDKLYPGYHTEAYFSEKIQQYYNDFDIIYAKTYKIDISGMTRYKKQNIPIGYVIPQEFLPIGTPITIRTLEGDIDNVVSKDMYILIGIKGEVYPNTKEKFYRSYKVSDEPYDMSAPYRPTIKNRIDGSTIALDKYAKSCISTGETHIYSRQLEKAVKVFTSWDEDKYMLGRVGDYIAVRSDDLHDIYVIEQDIFNKTYKEYLG
jgi:phosphoglycolate phosphatase